MIFFYKGSVMFTIAALFSSIFLNPIFASSVTGMNVESGTVYIGNAPEGTYLTESRSSGVFYLWIRKKHPSGGRLTVDLVQGPFFPARHPHLVTNLTLDIDNASLNGQSGWKDSDGDLTSFRVFYNYDPSIAPVGPTLEIVQVQNPKPQLLPLQEQAVPLIAKKPNPGDYAVEFETPKAIKIVTLTVSNDDGMWIEIKELLPEIPVAPSSWNPFTLEGQLTDSEGKPILRIEVYLDTATGNPVKAKVLAE